MSWESTIAAILHNPPNKVTISQTSYLEGQTASLICVASGGNPEVYNYTWSPDNYPPANVIKINLTRALNKKTFTCNGHHKCKGGNPVSSTIKLNVEYYPIINTIDNMTVIENKTNEFSCLAEGNPKPTITWKIRNQIYKSKLLQVSFTRSNVSKVQCIATANSSQDGILKSSKNISIFVTYPPEIKIHHKVTSLNEQAEISCTAEARPNNIQYKIIQKWGNKEKRIITAKKKSFPNFSYYDLGNWICQASNDVPYKGYYIHKSVEIQLNVAAHFQGNENETGIVESEKLLKICFYCNPDATDVKWYKGNEEMPFDRISYIPAENGLFPFLGNCSILKLDIQEKEIQKYSLKVINPVGERTFELTLETVNSDSPVNIIVSSVIAVIIVLLIIIGGIVFFIFRRSSKKTQSNNIPINNLRMSTGQEDGHEPYYAEISDTLPMEGQENGNEPQYIDLTSGSPVTGKENGNEPQYINATNIQVVKGKVNGNEPVYMNVADRSPVKGQEDGPESHYAEISDILPVEGEENGNEPQYIDLTSGSPITGEENGNEPQYIDLISGSPITGQQYGEEPHYISMTNRQPIKGKEYRNEPQYINATNIQVVKGKVNGNEPVYMNVADRSPVKGKGNKNESQYTCLTSRPPVTGHLDYEKLEN
ncbi:OPCML [Acanthosepion pharaonis]|uniref:OPCML n=1 Tax=Acanthosepion pharaonis TaxID=158019 RepID=A0A812CZB4_ACAPH|nr:OPCML [Sepia pharaonis]